MRSFSFLLVLGISSLTVFAQQKKTATPSKPATLTAIKGATSFIAMGDWGRNGEYKQKEVAVQMGISAKQLDASFMLILGDNFYPSGVASTQDYQWIASFENIYTSHALQTDWYVALGNHDYKGNPQAQVDYSKISRRWRMPERYFAKKISLGEDTTQQILLVILDTSPFISQYYTSEDHRDNIRNQDTAAQRKWLEQVLSDPSPNIKWRIVAGHHPLYTGGKRINSADTKEMNRLLKPIFDKYKVDAYIAGHEHSLQYIKPAGPTHYFVSGAGSEITPAVVHPDGGKFAVSSNGFMVFSVTSKEMLVQVVNERGDVLYKEAITK